MVTIRGHGYEEYGALDGSDSSAGETAAANSGGQSGVTDSFIDAFW
jgi:hypothetical protein